MSNRLVLKVTWRDIRKAMPFNAGNCPLALAGRRTLRVKRVEVNTGGYNDLRTARRRWLLTPDALQFGNDFDRGRPVKPQTFVLKRGIARD